MILDHIKNVDRYASLGGRFQAALEWLKTTDFSDKPVGERIIIDGDNIYATVSETRTRKMVADEISLEAHQAYADIQYVICGEECMGCARLGTREPSTEYDSQKDVQFFAGDWDLLHLKSGDFFVAFPEDLHAPCITNDIVSDVKRVVMKVRLLE